MIKILFVDVDGTLTESRDTYRLSVEAVLALRRLVERDVMVSIVSSNAVPVVIGLSRYLGLNGPVVAETGAVIYDPAIGIVFTSDAQTREAVSAVLESFGDCLENSWQNPFRLVEFALKPREECKTRIRSLLPSIKELVESRFPGLTADYSGYALHIKPKGVDKGTGVEWVLRKYGLKREETAAIGDSYMDKDMMRHVYWSAAVGNADEELKAACRIVLNSPSGLGVAEFVDYLFKEGLVP